MKQGAVIVGAVMLVLALSLLLARWVGAPPPFLRRPPVPCTITPAMLDVAPAPTWQQLC